jgi:hypothetical protein
MGLRISIGLCLTLGCIGCAEMNTHVRTLAARDLSCGEEHTRIVDSESGVYRMQGCGFEASYTCAETASLDIRCERIYIGKLDEAAGEEKPTSGSSLAKSR